MKKYKSFQNKAVKYKFLSYPEKVRTKLLGLRELIFETAEKIEGVGPLEECLKWNEPSYLTKESKSGSTIRIDWKERDPDYYFLFVNCKTKLVAIYKELYPDSFVYQGNRSIAFPFKKKLSKQKTTKLIEIALTYNKNKYKDFFK